MISTIVYSAFVFYFVSKHLRTIPIHKILVKPVIGVLFMGVFTYYLAYLSSFLLIPLAAGVYLVAILILRTFSDEEWGIVKKAIGKD